MASDLLQLAKLISASATTLVAAAEADNLPIPNLNDSFSLESEGFRANPAIRDAANIIIAAATQISALVAPPAMSIWTCASGHYRSAALRTCIELNVTEILRESGPQGLHVDQIASKAGVDSAKLARLLRVLCNHHIYREVTPDVFSNTRITGILDTGKPVKEIQQNPEDKHEGTPGLLAMIEHFLADGQKASSFILENLKDPKTAFSGEPNEAPLHRVFNVDIPLWEWYELPEQSYRRRRFAVAMNGFGQMQPPEILVNALDWGALPDGSKVVDVGGGIGYSSLQISRAFTNVHCVIQDFPEVCRQAKEFWSTEHPSAVESGRVEFQPHNFFTPQPVNDASVFIIKQVLHDWSDPYCSKILTELRKVAREDTQLLVVDNIVSPVCHDTTFDGESSIIPGATIEDAPAPLLANFGAANEMNYMVDMIMLSFLNSQERTIAHMSTMLAQHGWRVVRCIRVKPPSSFFESIIAVPIPGFSF